MQWLAAANLFSLFLTAYLQLLTFKDLMLFEYYVFGYFFLYFSELFFKEFPEKRIT